MSLQQRAIEPVPTETVKVAKAAFPKGNRYLKLRGELGTIYHDALFADLYPRVGQPAYCAWRLALVTVRQFAEQLPDREAAEAVRSRIDWKYLLGLELTIRVSTIRCCASFAHDSSRAVPQSGCLTA